MIGIVLMWRLNNMNEEICLDCGNTVRYISDSWVHVDSESVPCFLESQKNWNRKEVK